MEQMVILSYVKGVITGIHHIAISVPDLEIASKFYHEVLGFEKVFDNRWNGDRPIADQVIGLEKTQAKVQMLKAGNAYLEIWEYGFPIPETQDFNYSAANHGLAHFALQVTDITSEYERLSDNGMTFHSPPVDLGGSFAIYGRDPFGNILELYEVSEERSI